MRKSNRRFDLLLGFVYAWFSLWLNSQHKATGIEIRRISMTSHRNSFYWTKGPIEKCSPFSISQRLILMSRSNLPKWPTHGSVISNLPEFNTKVLNSQKSAPRPFSRESFRQIHHIRPSFSWFQPYFGWNHHFSENQHFCVDFHDFSIFGKS